VEIKNFKLKCQNIETAYHSQGEVKRSIDDFIAWSEEICENFKKTYNFEVLDIFLATGLSIASKRRKYQSYILDDFLTTIHRYLFFRLWFQELPETPMVLDKFLVENEKNANHKIMHQRALKVLPFIHELFEIKQPRDSYGNKRKTHAIKILGLIWNFYDTSSGMELCAEALKSKPEDLVVETAEVLTSYHLFRKLPLMKMLIPSLEWQVAKTKHRYVAAQCLDLMKQTKYISEGDCYEQLRDWKIRNDYPFY